VTKKDSLRFLNTLARDLDLSRRKREEAERRF